MGLFRFGAKGFAELGVHLASAALINSIHNATAVRVLYVAVTLDKLHGELPAM